MTSIKLDGYVNMVRKLAHYYANYYGMEYDELEGQGFLIYTLALQAHNPAKASFSTFLYTNLKGRLADFCKQQIARTWRNQAADMVMVNQAGGFLENENAPTTAIELLEERKDYPREKFLEYASDYLSPIAKTLLVWCLDKEHPEMRKKPSYTAAIKELNYPKERVKSAWEELKVFWQNAGSSFYA